MTQTKEMVHHPDHYNHSEIETFELFLLNFSYNADMIKGALLFNINKYRDRSQFKNGQEDIDKMNWYLDKLDLLFPENTNLYACYHISKEKPSKD